jgi:peptidyl-tRNA hydrolase
MRSVIDVVGQADIKRARIGIGRDGNGCELADYVLSRIPAADKGLFSGAIGFTAKALIRLIDDGDFSLFVRQLAEYGGKAANGIIICEARNTNEQADASK